MKKLRIPNFLWPPAKWSNRYPPHIGTIATSPLYVNLVCHNSADNHLSQNIALMCSYVWSGVTHTQLCMFLQCKNYLQYVAHFVEVIEKACRKWWLANSAARARWDKNEQLLLQTWDPSSDSIFHVLILPWDLWMILDVTLLTVAGHRSNCKKGL